MKCSADRLVDALVGSQTVDTRSRACGLTRAGRPGVVTVSRECGALGEDVAQLLAGALELRCCDRMILQDVALRAHVDERLVAALDEHVSEHGGDWWRRFLYGEGFTYDEYFEHLVKIVHWISRTGGVILGRGANMILGPENAFRVRVTGSLDHCARIIAERDHVDIDAAKESARQDNEERAEYIRKLYDADIDDLDNYDLVLNAERYSNIEMVELVLDAMEKAGYVIPEDARSSLEALSGGKAG